MRQDRTQISFPDNNREVRTDVLTMSANASPTAAYGTWIIFRRIEILEATNGARRSPNPIKYLVVVTFNLTVSFVYLSDLLRAFQDP